MSFVYHVQMLMTCVRSLIPFVMTWAFDFWKQLTSVAAKVCLGL